ncbi:hypothetical protein GobsU_17960 [Candidatus Moduliflexus flocculans]|uniref:Polymorphic outer membrane protein n=1 Tax=Candidatus Moduliflexus flocculans TaxID=1499966 RepID=A0A081BP14_9BACT|nr:hypothetical protein GobsU_17960 [Candidatus Moduliflexus flocculans]
MKRGGFYERVTSNFFVGGGDTAATISGLILASALIAGLMISCKEESSSKPTSPNIPIYPEGQTSDNSNQMGFYSAKGDGQFGAFVNENSEFQISVPAGEFLLTYVTNTGTYYVAFRATNAAILFIGLNKGGQVLEASVQKGKITNESQKNWRSNSVTLFAWPGSDLVWNAAFQSDGSAAVVLIKNQSVAPDVNKLPEPSRPVPCPVTNPTATPTPEPGTPTATPTIQIPTPTPTTIIPTPTSANPCVVTNANDSGAGSLRQLLTNAACPTITFASDVTTITLAGTHLTVVRNVTIDGGSGVTISGNNQSRVFYVNNGVTATFAGLTITGGKTFGYGGTEGGGIYNLGTLTLESSTTISGNIADYGGGIGNFKTLIVNGVVTGNTAGNFGDGGGIFSGGTLIVNGIVSNNTAGRWGGGIAIHGGSITINGTVSDNMIMGNGGGIHNHDGTLTVSGIVSGNKATGDGGGILNDSTLILEAGHRIEGNHADNDNDSNGNSGGIRTMGVCPTNANYGGGNYRGSGSMTIDNCNGNP